MCQADKETDPPLSRPHQEAINEETLAERLEAVLGTAKEGGDVILRLKIPGFCFSVFFFFLMCSPSKKAFQDLVASRLVKQILGYLNISLFIFYFVIKKGTCLFQGAFVGHSKQICW